MFRYPGMEAQADDAACAVGITNELRQRLSGWLRTLPDVS